MRKFYLRSGSTSPTPTNTGSIPFVVGGNPGGGNFSAFTPAKLAETTDTATTGGPMTVSSNGARGMLFVTDAGEPAFSAFPTGAWAAQLKVTAVTGGGSEPTNLWIVRLDEDNDILEAHVLTEDIPEEISAPEIHTWSGSIASWAGGSATDRLGCVFGFKDGGGGSTYSVELDAGASFIAYGQMLVGEHINFGYLGEDTFGGVFDLQRVRGPQPSGNTTDTARWAAGGYTLEPALDPLGSGQTIVAPDAVSFTVPSVHASLGHSGFLRFQLADVVSQSILDMGTASIGTDASGHVELVADATTLTGATVLAVDTTYILEWGLKVHATTGRATLRLDGAPEAAVTGSDTGTVEIDSWAFDNPDLKFGDFSVQLSKNKAGSVDNGDFEDDAFLTIPGTPHFGHTMPADDGDYIDWVIGTGSGDEWEQLAEAGNGGLYDHLDTTLTTSGGSARQSWLHDDAPANVGEIVYVLSRIAVRPTTDDECFLGHFLRIGSSDYDHTDNGPVNAFLEVGAQIRFDSRLWLTDPDTNVGFVLAGLSGLQLGCFPIDLTGTMTITTGVLEFLWYSAPTPPTFGSGDLYTLPMLGVGW